MSGRKSVGGAVGDEEDVQNVTHSFAVWGSWGERDFAKASFYSFVIFSFSCNNLERFSNPDVDKYKCFLFH